MPFLFSLYFPLCLLVVVRQKMAQVCGCVFFIRKISLLGSLVVRRILNPDHPENDGAGASNSVGAPPCGAGQEREPGGGWGGGAFGQSTPGPSRKVFYSSSPFSPPPPSALSALIPMGITGSNVDRTGRVRRSYSVILV